MQPSKKHHCVSSYRCLLALFLAISVILMPGCYKEPVASDSQEDVYLMAIAATTFATLITYCKTKHGSLETSQGERCFMVAKEKLSDSYMQEQTAILRNKCDDPATHGRCFTPVLGKLTQELIRYFDSLAL